MSTKILFVFDTPTLIKGPSAIEILQSPSFEEDFEIFSEIKNLGYDVLPYAIYDDLRDFFEIIQSFKPDLIFHLAESFCGDRAHEAHLAAFYQLIGVPFTGARSEILNLCSDKALTKKILSHHRIKTPLFETFGGNFSLERAKLFSYPGIVKPLNLEGSEGISQSSFVSNASEAVQRAEWIFNKFNVDAIFEEYIDGRELYVALLGGKRPTSLPIREHFFGDAGENAPKIATYNAKWNDDYRKKRGIKNGFAKNLSPALESKIQSSAKRITRILGLETFARIDFRMKSDGALYFLEANPNPCLYKSDELALSAAQAGLEYSKLIEKIIKEALERAGPSR